MLSSKLLVCLVLLSVAYTLHLNLNHQNSLASGRATFKSDNGQYLKRCHQCGGAYQDSVSVNGLDPKDPLAIWTVQLVGNQVAFKADTGKYLSRCNNCWYNSQDSAFLHVPSLQGAPWSLWTPQQLSDGKWAFRGDNGKYLTRCNDCTEGEGTNQFAFVQGTSSSDSNAQWTVQYIVTSSFPSGPVAIKGVFGMYILRCISCGKDQGAKQNNPVMIEGMSSKQENARWTPQFFGDKIALRADNGQYLARCQNCWQTGSSPDSAFVYVNDPRQNSKALWTPEKANGGGQWSFRSDNGKYLSTCRDCLKPLNGKQLFGDFVFVDQKINNNWLAWWEIQAA